MGQDKDICIHGGKPEEKNPSDANASIQHFPQAD